jgi:hypothetical protein
MRTIVIAGPLVLAGSAHANTRMATLDVVGPCHEAIWMEWIKQPFDLRACTMPSNELLICTPKECVTYKAERLGK